MGLPSGRIVLAGQCRRIRGGGIHAITNQERLSRSLSLQLTPEGCLSLSAGEERLSSEAIGAGPRRMLLTPLFPTSNLKSEKAQLNSKGMSAGNSKLF